MHKPLSPGDAVAIHIFRKPLTKRFFYALWRHGWLVVVAVLAVLVLTGCEDMEAEKATAASLRDALAQAQKDRPELWTAEHKKRADVAMNLIAQGAKP